MFIDYNFESEEAITDTIFENCNSNFIINQ